jgi:demethylmenaquinone methyltransferase / 2-methoxy-6-polyprenyl-1,4-benzoquinol methylase
MRQAIDRRILTAIYDRVSPRYDLQHAILTAGSDQRGRKLLVEHAVEPGDRVLDCGAGTGSTALLAARKAGSPGTVTLFDMSEGMLAVARQRANAAGIGGRIKFHTGEMTHLPFIDGSFDVGLSTYSMCPLDDPSKGALELYRVVRPGGRIGIAHSSDPKNRMIKRLADLVEALIWRFPSVSFGCRSVSVLPALTNAGASVVFEKMIGIPIWPFLVLVVHKPDCSAIPEE